MAKDKCGKTINNDAWIRYELEKQKLKKARLSPEEYEKRVRELARRLGI